jgi:hypothetical protein
MERTVEELAAESRLRLPGPKIDALLQVADAVTCHYGLADQLETWVERIPVKEAFIPYASQHWSLLNHWQPKWPVPGARSPADWWLFLSRRPIDWGSLDELPVHVIVAHIAPTYYWGHPWTMLETWGRSATLLSGVANSDRPWPAIARMRPVVAVRRLNEIALRDGKRDA